MTINVINKTRLAIRTRVKIKISLYSKYINRFLEIVENVLMSIDLIISRKRLIYSEYNDIFIFTRVLIVSPALSATSVIIILSSAPVLIRAKYSIILLIITGIVGAAVIEKKRLIVIIE